MRRRNEIRKGSITIFLALFLSLFVGLLYVGLRSAKMAAARTQALCSADIGLFSLFGQYDRDAFEYLGLFLLRGEHDAGETDLASLYYQFQTYAEPVLHQNQQSMELLRGGFSGYRLVTDEGGEPFYEQAVKAEKMQKHPEKEENLPMSFAEMEEYQRKGKTFEQELREFLEDQSMQELLAAGEAHALEDAEEVPEDSIQEQERAHLQELLQQSLFEKLEVSESVFSEVDPGMLLSNREIEHGISMLDNYVPEKSSAEIAYMRSFLVENLGNFLDPAEKAPFCALEYVIEGQGEDRENMKELLTRLVWIMEGIEQEKQGTGEKDLSWYNRIYLQGLEDTREILHNGEGRYFSYEEFLRIQLAGCSRNVLIWRGMDMIEQKMRALKNNSFCMDHCLVAAEISLSIEANGQKTFQVVKQYGYE